MFRAVVEGKELKNGVQTKGREGATGSPQVEQEGRPRGCDRTEKERPELCTGALPQNFYLPQESL